MEKKLTLHLSDGSTLELLSFEYNAKRMAGAPTITATIKSFDALDISTNCYTEFNGERYYIKQVPTCTKDNTDARYKYELNFVSERDILDNIFFYDSSKASSTADARVAHNTTFQWSGTLRDYIDKLNESLAFSLGEDSYHISKDGIADQSSLEYKMISLQGQYFTTALQEIYNTFEMPYYFDGKTIYVGAQGSSINEDYALEYGADKGLLSIQKTNANFKVVNKCTATGSSDNLPYYYPNKSADGEHTVTWNESEFGNVLVNFDVLSKLVNLGGGETLEFHSKYDDSAPKEKTITYEKYSPTVTTYPFSTVGTKMNVSSFTDTIVVAASGVTSVDLTFNSYPNTTHTISIGYAFSTLGSDLITELESYSMYRCYVWFTATDSNTNLDDFEVTIDGHYITFTTPNLNLGQITVKVKMYFEVVFKNSVTTQTPLNMSFSHMFVTKSRKNDYFLCKKSNKEINFEDSGVSVGQTFEGGIIEIGPSKNLMPYQPNLVPSVYRATLGAERFYKAKNEKYTETALDDDENTLTYDVEYFDEDGNRIVFDNPYDVDSRNYREHTFTVDDLKPTIKEVEYKGLRIDQIEDVAFDKNDNNELNDDNEYKHSYFYVKLRPLGFNLFDHASEQGEMTMSMTSGDCSACNFTIGVNEDKKNDFQVDDDGNLVFGDDGVPKRGTPQTKQNNTSTNYVWIALKKENQTYGTVMPDKLRGVVPKSGDSFVFLNINLPFEYILAAEKKLEDKIKQYLIDNNKEKFNFSIKFSRIFLAENEPFRTMLNENSRILINYDTNSANVKNSVWLYVSGFSYKMTEGDALPEISVTLTDTLATQKAPLQNVINQVKADVQTSIESIDVVAQCARSFIRKDTSDQTVHSITANQLSATDSLSAGGDATIGGSTSIGGEIDVEGEAVFNDNINVAGDITIKGYEEVLGEIKGAKIDQQGNAVFNTLRANYMEVFSMMYNQIQASSAYTVFDDTGTVISATADENGVYTLTFDSSEFYTKDDEGLGVQPFFVGDILHGYVNKVNNFAYSQAGECWMRVTAIPSSDNELESNQILAELFDDDQVPTAPNLAPTTKMTLAHRGNVSDTTRQSTFYISSKDANVIQLLGVSSPKLYNIDDGYSNYGVVMGLLPTDLFKYLNDRFPFTKQTDPVLYAKYLAVENLLQIDYLGRPIKSERYRGEWSADQATEDPYRAVGATDVTYYDTVIHNGGKWQCVYDKTAEEPTDGSVDWLSLTARGKDAAPIYEFRISPTSIYVDGNGAINSSMLYMSVGETSGDGFSILAVQSQLDERNLKIQYSVDDGETRTDVSLSPTLIETEEANGILSSEEELAFMLEGEGIIVDKSWDKITLYLVDTVNGIDRLAHDVPITKSGTIAQGNLLPNSNFDIYEDDGTTLKNWEVQLGDVEENYYLGQNAYHRRASRLTYAIFLATTTKAFISPTIGDYVLSFYLYQSQTNLRVTLSSTDGTALPFSVRADYCTVTEESDKVYIDVTTLDYQVWSKVVVNIKTNEEVDFPVYISFENINNSDNYYAYTIYLSMIKLEASSIATPYQKAQSDLVGPAGEAGPLYYPAGEWKSDVLYQKTSANVPFVYYDPSGDGSGRYYKLIADSASGEDQSPAYDEYWEYIEQYESIFTKFLMANYALFGGDNGAVFYDKYLFSQKGLSAEGVYGGYTKGMFTDGLLNGSFQPNLFLDFLSGAIKGNKFSETFKEFEYISKTIANEVADYDGYTEDPAEGSMLLTPCCVLDTESGYNVSIEPDIDVRWAEASETGANFVYDINESGLMLSMPLVNDIKDGSTILESKAPWEPDGMKVTILVRENDEWNKIVQHAEGVLYNDATVNSAYIARDCLERGVVLCADARVLNQKSYKGETYNGVTTITFNPSNYNISGESLDTAQYGGFFVVKGRICKFLFVEPGMMVRLRSCTCSLSITGSSSGTNKLPLWYVDNSDDFAEVDAKVVFQGHYYYQNGAMNKFPEYEGLDEDDNEVTFTHYAFGYGYSNAGTQGTGFAFKNYAFATKSLADVYAVAKDYSTKNGKAVLDKVYIRTRDDRFAGTIEADICMVSTSNELDGFGSANAFTK